MYSRSIAAAVITAVVFVAACDRPDQGKEKGEASERRAQYEADGM